MTRIEELRQKKKEIDEEIKRLQKADYRCIGVVRFDSESFPTNIPKEYMVSVRYQPLRGGVARWVSIARGYTRQEAIEKIPVIIKDLTGLYNELIKDKEVEE